MITSFPRNNKRVLVPGTFVAAEVRQFHRLRFSLTILILALVLAPLSAAQESHLIGDPLVVDQHSRVVVLEYEAWFGPNAVTFQGAAVLEYCRAHRDQGFILSVCAKSVQRGDRVNAPVKTTKAFVYSQKEVARPRGRF